MEEQLANRNKLENKIGELQKMVMMQEQTIRILLNVNEEAPLHALSLKNSNQGSGSGEVNPF